MNGINKKKDKRAEGAKSVRTTKTVGTLMASFIHVARGENSFNYYYDANVLTAVKYCLTPKGDAARLRAVSRNFAQLAERTNVT